MTKKRTPYVLALAGILLAGPSDPHGASANIFKKAGKSIEQGANKVVDKGKDAADKGKDAASDVVDKGKDAVDELSGATKKELREISQVAARTYASSTKTLDSEYKKALAEAQKVMTAAQQAAYKAAAKAFYEANQADIAAVTRRWAELMKDKSFAERVTRVLRQAAERKINERSREDLQYITSQLLGDYEEPEKVGLHELKPRLDSAPSDEPERGRGRPEEAYVPVAATSDTRPRKIKWLRSFTLVTTFTVAEGGGGAEAAVGMSVDLYKKNDRKYVECKLLVEAGGLFGPGVIAQAGIAFGLWPIWTKDAPGAQFGIYGGAASGGYGGQATVIWNFTGTYSVNPTPGFSVAVAPGEGAELGLQYGWTEDAGPSGWK